MLMLNVAGEQLTASFQEGCHMSASGCTLCDYIRLPNVQTAMRCMAIQPANELLFVLQAWQHTQRAPTACCILPGCYVCSRG